MANTSTFKDFLLATRDVRFTNTDKLIIEANLNTYFMDKILKGSGAEKLFRGGTQLTDRILTSDNGSFQFYNPNQEFAPTATDNLVAITVPWAMSEANYPYTEETVSMNKGDPIRYLDLKESYEAQALLSFVNGTEAALWALPDSSKMESPGPDAPINSMSILALVTRDGLAPSSTNGGIAGGSNPWTTVQSLAPSTNTWYQNYNTTYSAANPTDLDVGIIPSFDKTVSKIKFEVPTGIRKFSEDDKLQKQCIVTNLDGISLYKRALRAANDRMDMLKDPAIPGPQYQGIPLMYISTLDGVGWTAGVPDFLFLNLSYLRAAIREDWWMKMKVVDGGVKQPNTTVVFYFTHYNLICLSRRRQARISGV